MSGAEDGPGAGDHVDFHDNVFHGKVVGAEYHRHEHYHYPPAPEPGQIVEGDIPQRPPGFQSREQLLQRLAGLLGDQAPGQSGDGGEHRGAVAICAMAGNPGWARRCWPPPTPGRVRPRAGRWWPGSPPRPPSRS
ncbi:hypothetical protein [Nonomuraea maheshkhaliensis]|uniref:hypothetical protein n=1 Tax=Nonomuraea maheshkhaliensis TaxID=419590 RepID=UPI0031F7D0DD